MKIVARRLPGALPLPVLLLLAPIAWARPLPQTGVATTAWVASTHEPNGISSAPMAEPVTDTVFEVLHTFAGGPDGANSYASLIQADDGNLYGTTYNGGGGFGCGESGCGTVFQLSYDGTRYRVLHAFQGGTDGARPEASLFQASDGHLYGTTSEGGGSGCDGSGCGTLFRIGLDGTDYAVVYAFSGGTTDGAHPVAAVIQASDGLLYGTTVDGGAVESRCTLGCGTVFRISLYGTAFTVVHWFTPRDGIHPEASVVQTSSGYLYGTTSTLGGGGSAGCIAPEVLECGTVFQMDLDGVEFNVRHVFSGAPDGNHPHAALIEATDGLLYGTTIFGGGNATDEPRLGIVFQMTPDGNVYRRYWLRKAGGFGTAYPYAALVEAADGNFYLTVRGFPGFKGAVLRMTADGGFTTLYSFSGEEDGGNPQAGLIQTADGTFYGTTSSGGLGRPGLGVVFRLIVRE